VVGCHGGGEIGSLIVGGVLSPMSETVFDQMQTLAADSVRRLLLRESRGSVAVHANLIAWLDVLERVVEVRAACREGRVKRVELTNATATTRYRRATCSRTPGWSMNSSRAGRRY
jgi:proline racemase